MCVSNRTWVGLRDSDRTFLLVPKKRKFDPFGESLRGKLRRLVTGSDGLNNLGSQERQPNQAPDVIREDPFTLSYRYNRFHSTRKQIVSPLASASDRFHEREISQRSWLAITLDNQTHFEAAPPDLHREDARDSQLSGVVIARFFRDGIRQLDRNANACIDAAATVRRS